jgi:hypothetical protein
MRVVSIAAIVLAITTFMRADIVLSRGLCIASEISFFTCQTTNKRWISLCGAPPGKLQYRYGSQGHAEFLYPEKTADSLASFRFAQYSRFQTERIEVAFRNQGVDYAVFDYTEAHIRHAGVRVVTPDGKEREFACASRPTSRLAELKESLQCDGENALNGGNCPTGKTSERP